VWISYVEFVFEFSPSVKVTHSALQKNDSHNLFLLNHSSETAHRAWAEFFKCKVWSRSIKTGSVTLLMGGVGTCFFAGIWPCVSYLHGRKDGPKLLGSAPSTYVEQALLMMSHHISGSTQNVGREGTVFCNRLWVNLGGKIVHRLIKYYKLLLLASAWVVLTHLNGLRLHPSWWQSLSGATATSRHSDSVTHVQEIIRENRWLTGRKIPAEVGI